MTLFGPADLLMGWMDRIYINYFYKYTDRVNLSLENSSSLPIRNKAAI
jgi:hypothetical protein